MSGTFSGWKIKKNLKIAGLKNGSIRYIRIFKTIADPRNHAVTYYQALEILWPEAEKTRKMTRF